MRLSAKYSPVFLLSCAYLFVFSFAAAAQNPYRVAGNHYQLILENQWIRATRVIYAPGETAPLHDHPKGGAIIYVYLTDAGTMRFRHVDPFHIADRPPVKAGSLRLAGGTAETHSVEYLGNVPSEYIILELRTTSTSPAFPFKRLPPVSLDPAKSTSQVQFEDAQLRVLRVSCAAGEHCPDSRHPDDQAIVVVLTGTQKGAVKWSPERMEGAMQQIRFELKSPPAPIYSETKERPTK